MSSPFNIKNMLSDYIKNIKIISIDTDTGILKWEIVYNTHIKYGDRSDEITKLEDSLITTNRIPGSGDKMYFLNGVIVPRFKLKEFHKNKGTTLVKYVESANIVVIGKNTIDNFFNSSSTYTINIRKIEKYLSTWLLNNHKYNHLDDKWALKLLDEIKIIDEDLLLAYHYRYKTYLEENKIELEEEDWNNIILSQEQYIALEKIMNLKCDIIKEEIILKELNSTLTMDKTMYESIKNLMDSKDNDNLKLAMEMMANCDYDTSSLYLLLLLKEYDYKISRNSSKHHVNFKAMLHYFDYTPSSNFTIDIDGIITKLKDRKIPIINFIDVLTPLILADFKDDSEHYKASSVILLDEEGNDIVLEQNTENVWVEKAVKEDIIEEIIIPEGIIEVENCIKDIVISYSNIKQHELDEVIYEELGEVFLFCKVNEIIEYRDIIFDVKHCNRCADDLLQIIEFMEDGDHHEQVTVLTQCYLDII